MAAGRTNPVKRLSRTLTMLASGSAILVLQTGDRIRPFAAARPRTEARGSGRIMNLSSLSATVSVTMYSGRTDPTWVLAHPEAERVLDRLRKMPRLAALEPEHPKLGYRGLAVEIETGDRADRWELHRGRVLGHDGRQYADRDRSLERLLLETGPGNYRDEIADLVAREF